MIRSQAADYGFELNEFDPFFNYRATQFIVDNGFGAYYDWNDDLSWHPQGRDVSALSQTMLHITAAILYQIFGGNFSVYEFVIIFPVVFGSLTVFLIFALVRLIGGTTAGLFSALFFAISVPVIVRGTIGWFKSEPLGLFYGMLGLYLFLSGIQSKNRKITFLKLIGGGIFLAFGLGSWGGVQFFVIPIGIFILALPFLRKDHSFLIWAIPTFVASLLLSILIFERPGTSFVFGLGGFALIGPIAFMAVCIFIQKLSKEGKKIRNGLFLLGGTIVSGILIISSGIIPGPSFRYLNAVNPFLTTENPLVDSVAEHATTTTAQSFYFLSILMIFAGIGIWLILKNQGEWKFPIKLKNDLLIFSLIFGLLGVYVSSAFVRLELFASISVIILASIGLSLLTAGFLRRNTNDKDQTNPPRTVTKIVFVIVIIGLLLIPTTLPVNGNWIQGVKAPPTILNGGTSFNIVTNDWPETLEWMKNNTPENSVVAAWWDYGYWITTVSERKTLADNATLDSKRIENIAKTFLSPPDEAWTLLNELDADYVLVYVAAQRINDNEDPALYLLTGGGDESKKQWFIRIAKESLTKYLHSDGLSGTDYFWQNSLLGKMFPFSPVIYVNLADNSQSETYQPGFTPIYVQDVKYPIDGSGPLKLVHTSPSFNRSSSGPISGVIVYEVNKDYRPSEVQIPSKEIQSQNKEVGIIKTSFGDIVIEFKEDTAPNTTENFKNLSRTGFYDGTIFHRIIPGFVIQGGDPNTITETRDTWGQGGPGYSINAELSDLKHKKYIVSMARGPEINSAGSQFFIMLGDAPYLDGQYTIFGEVIIGHEVVDQIALIETNDQNQPLNPEKAKMEKLIISTLEK